MIMERIVPAERGFVILYRGPSTPCPGCHRSNWIVGRLLAECGFCATAIPLAGGDRG